MDDCILGTIKDLVLGSKDDNSFDTELILNINTALLTLIEFGVKPKEGFSLVSTGDEAWSDFFDSSDRIILEFGKTYVHLKTKLKFDPPANAFLVQALESEIAKLEFYIIEVMERRPSY